MYCHDMDFYFRFTYEMAPVFTLMEEIILTRMAHLIGWTNGDAIFAPGKYNLTFVSEDCTAGTGGGGGRGFWRS